MTIDFNTPTLEQIQAAPDCIEIVQAAEVRADGLSRATVVSWSSRSLGFRATQARGYMWPVEDRRFMGEAGRSEPVVEAI